MRHLSETLLLQPRASSTRRTPPLLRSRTTFKCSTSKPTFLGEIPIVHALQNIPTDKQRRSMNLALADTAYSGWQPVRIDAGEAKSSSPRGKGDGFFINSTGLQWTSAPGANPAIDTFGGWIICDWWHGKSRGLLPFSLGPALNLTFSQVCRSSSFASPPTILHFQPVAQTSISNLSTSEAVAVQDVFTESMMLPVRMALFHVGCIPA